jgi:hypothetical protein
MRFMQVLAGTCTLAFNAKDAAPGLKGLSEPPKIGANPAKDPSTEQRMLAILRECIFS